jgi:uncharacterized membrane protein
VRRIALLAFALVLAAAFAGPAAGPAAAKDFTIPTVDIDATVRPNGDLRVVESRTLDFSGTFHFVYWDLSTKGSEGISVTGASGPAAGDPSATVPYEPASIPLMGLTGQTGTYAVADQGSTVRVQLNFELTDARAGFTVKYVAKGAAKRWDDIGELYWQFVGDQASVPCDHVRVTVHLPEGVTRDQVRAWAHGPLWGNVTIAPDASVVMTVDPLPEYTFVEGRILFPAAALTNARPTAGAREAAVLAEEQKWADQANRSRLWSRVKVIAWGVLGVGFIALALVLIVILYFKHGREPKTQFKAEYLRDIPQPPLPPALVASIWRMGTVGRDDATATLLDLVYRKVIDMQRVSVVKDGFFGSGEEITYQLTRHEDREADLLDYEKRLLKLLFEEIGHADTLVVSELKELAKKHRKSVSSGWTVWKNKVEKEAESRHYLDAKADRMAFSGAAFAFVGIVAAGAAAVLSGFLWFFLGVPVGILLVYAARTIKRRSQEAAELHAQYAALERYLKDFGRLDEKPPDAIVLWEQFLIYAVVFGCAAQVVKAISKKLPELLEHPDFAPTYFVFWGMPGGGLSAFDSLHDSFGEAVSVATSSSSSGSGGGGGFSGGGGGGGGGGGFGAGDRKSVV